MELHILTEGTQCPPRGNELEASDSNVGKRQKQAHHHEKPNDGHLKRDGTTLIREQGCGGQFVFFGQGSFTYNVTLGVTLILKAFGSGTLCCNMTS
jgi:hypothetical protein